MARRPGSVAARAARWTVAAISFTLIGCHSADRTGERAFVAGDRALALTEFRERRDRAAYDFVLESSLLASVALDAGDRRTSLAALVDAAVATELVPGEVPERVSRARSRRARAFYRLTPQESGVNSVYRALLHLDTGDYAKAEDAIQLGAKTLAESGSDEQTAAFAILRAFIDEKLGADEKVEPELARFRERIGSNPDFATADALSEANVIVWIDRGLIGPPGSGGERRSGDSFRFRFDDGPWQSPVRVLNLRRRSGAGPSESPARAQNPEASSLWGVLGGSLSLLTGWSRSDSDRYWHLLPIESSIWIGKVGDAPDLLNSSPTPSIMEFQTLDANGAVRATDAWTLPIVTGSVRWIYLRCR